MFSRIHSPNQFMIYSINITMFNNHYSGVPRQMAEYIETSVQLCTIFGQELPCWKPVFDQGEHTDRRKIFDNRYISTTDKENRFVFKLFIQKEKL